STLEVHGRRFADGADRHVDSHLLGHPDEEQVDMERPAVDRVDVDIVDEDRPRLLAVDREVDQGVGSQMAAKLLEVVAVEGDVRGIDAVAIDDGRDLAGTAEAGDLLAGDLSMFGGGCRAGGGPDGNLWSGVTSSFGVFR